MKETWGYNSVVEYLPSKHEVLGSSPTPKEKKKGAQDAARWLNA